MSGRQNETAERSSFVRNILDVLLISWDPCRCFLQHNALDAEFRHQSISGLVGLPSPALRSLGLSHSALVAGLQSQQQLVHSHSIVLREHEVQLFLHLPRQPAYPILRLLCNSPTIGCQAWTQNGARPMAGPAVTSRWGRVLFFPFASLETWPPQSRSKTMTQSETRRSSILP